MEQSELLRECQYLITLLLNFAPDTPGPNSLRKRGTRMLAAIKAELASSDPPPLGVSVSETIVTKDKLR